MTDWAPYQSTDPEAQRSSLRSPPPQQPLLSPGLHSSSSHINPWGGSSSIRADNAIGGSSNATGFGNTGEGNVGRGGREFVNQFETSLPIRMNAEAALAYLLFPPAGGALLLMLEHSSDYVRFHAWQSSLVFTAIFIIHLIFIWSKFFSWLIFALDLCLIAYLSFRAYRDADTLDRCEVPYFGQLASRFVDEEWKKHTLGERLFWRDFDRGDCGVDTMHCVLKRERWEKGIYHIYGVIRGLSYLFSLFFL